MKQLFNAPFNFYHNLAHGVRLVDDDGCSAIKESDVKPWALLDRFASNVVSAWIYIAVALLTSRTES